MLLGLVGLVVLAFELAATQSHTVVIRQETEDQFIIPGRCGEEACVIQSSGTGEQGDSCTCHCLPHAPVFREDLQICVDDIHECVIAPFAMGSSYQKVPYVFLPLKGQIINPSAEIVFTGVKSPMCIVSTAMYLTPGGWMELKNRTESEPPFRLYRDEGRSYLQWLGESDLRQLMEGRLLLIQMMCKEGDILDNSIFSTCVAFRVAGTPGEGRWSSVKEVSFSEETQTSDGRVGAGYVAMALVTVALGLAYAVGVALYLKNRRARRDMAKSDRGRSTSLSVVEEGVIKNNPLLRHCQDLSPMDGRMSCSDSEDCSDIFRLNDEIGPTQPSSNVQVTSAVVHPRHETREFQSDSTDDCSEATTIERLPEENLSIVESVETREDKTSILGYTNTRRKLYFNPAYFEYELLMAPPPAAIEFLTKIREVMSIAKAKMESKKFCPSLMGIAEEREDLSSCYECLSSRQSSPQSDAVKTGEFRCCHNCSDETKQHSIRQWLENLPVVKPLNYTPSVSSFIQSRKDVNESVSFNRKTGSVEGIDKGKNIFDNCSVSSRNSRKSDRSMQTPTVVSNNTLDRKNINSFSKEISNNDFGSRFEKFSRKACRDEYMANYECITDNACKELGLGIDSPIEYADILIDSSEKVNSPIVFNNGNSEYIKNDCKVETISNDKDDHDYETILISRSDETKSLPEFGCSMDAQSFISEIYVNNVGDYSVSDSSIQSNDSTNSLLRGRQDEDKSGPLMIQVDHLVDPTKRDYDSDNFEPDTLDRKPSRLTIKSEPPNPKNIIADFFTDSLERQPQISLKSSGSFRSSTEDFTDMSFIAHRNRAVMLNRAFGSLREIFVAKNRYNQCTHRSQVFSSLIGTTKSFNNQMSNFCWNKEKYKTLHPETKQAKRQRPPSPLHSLPPVPPDVTKQCSQYKTTRDSPPPLPLRKSKAVARDTSVSRGRKEPIDPPSIAFAIANKENESCSVRETIKIFSRLPEIIPTDDYVKTERASPCCHSKKNDSSGQVGQRTEDSGYLSTDSNNSDKGENRRESSETDDSFFDGASESGAESIATDSFSFGKILRSNSALSQYGHGHSPKLVSMVQS